MRSADMIARISSVLVAVPQFILANYMMGSPQDWPSYNTDYTRVGSPPLTEVVCSDLKADFTTRITQHAPAGGFPPEFCLF